MPALRTGTAAARARCPRAVQRPEIERVRTLDLRPGERGRSFAGDSSSLVK